MADAEKFGTGTSIKCVEHHGRHRGIVSRVLQPGVMYVVAWEGRGVSVDVNVGLVKMRYPKEIVQHHLLDLTACEAKKIERA